MYVSKTITLEAEDVVKIQKSVENGKAATFSEFVQNAIKNELRSDDHAI